MTPAAAVSGVYLHSPQAKYFAVGRIGRDQLDDYAERKGEPPADVERWLGQSLS
jgi:5-methyltetrahydrofolate--homocysteine methyltransferase